jgi:hypothetical protein
MKYSHSQIANFSLRQQASLNNNYNQFKFSRERINDIGLQREFTGLEVYEFANMNEQYIKPHFEIDGVWTNGICHKERDAYAINAVTFIIALFNIDPSEICLLYDEKESKCSLHINLSNTFTTMAELIIMKKTLKLVLEEHHFDINSVYCRGQSKFRTIYALKLIN